MNRLPVMRSWCWLLSLRLNGTHSPDPFQSTLSLLVPLFRMPLSKSFPQSNVNPRYRNYAIGWSLLWLLWLRLLSLLWLLLAVVLVVVSHLVLQHGPVLYIGYRQQGIEGYIP